MANLPPAFLIFLAVVVLVVLVLVVVVVVLADLDVEWAILRRERIVVQHGSILSVPAIILAAGRSSRMGAPKAGLRLPGGESFLERIARELIAGGADPVIVVVSADAAAPDGERVGTTGRAPAQFVTNPAPDQGQLSSLQCGLAAVPAACAVLATLVDIPLVTAAAVQGLIDAWAASSAPLVRLTRAGRHGHPVLMAERLLAEVRAADPSVTTTRDLVRRYAAAGVEIETEDEGPFLDVDTPEEYRRLIASLIDRR